MRYDYVRGGYFDENGDEWEEDHEHPLSAWNNIILKPIKKVNSKMNNANFMLDHELLHAARCMPATHTKEEWCHLALVLSRKYEKALEDLQVAQPFVDAINNLIEMRLHEKED